MNLFDALETLSQVAARNDERLDEHEKRIQSLELRVAGIERRQAEIIQQQANRILGLEQSVYLMSVQLANRDIQGREIWLN